MCPPSAAGPPPGHRDRRRATPREVVRQVVAAASQPGGVWRQQRRRVAAAVVAAAVVMAARRVQHTAVPQSWPEHQPASLTTNAVATSDVELDQSLTQDDPQNSVPPCQCSAGDVEDNEDMADLNVA